jgi:hypothetical protein
MPKADVTVYRFENIVTTDSRKVLWLFPIGSVRRIDRLYTADSDEGQRAGYHYGGIAWSCFSQPMPGTSPLYREHSEITSDHLYTTDAAEKERAQQTSGYVPEGVLCHVFTTQVPGTCPIYRLLLPAASENNMAHFYTLTPSERDGALSGTADRGYKYVSEGIVGYAVPYNGKADNCH